MQNKNWKNVDNPASDRRADLQKNPIPDPGLKGLPEDYPVPRHTDDLLFYIQRNHNKNTVVYELNRTSTGAVNTHYPMHVYWVKFSDGGDQQELNYIQNKLAYGYTSRQINAQTFEFHFVSYRDLRVFIVADDDGCYSAVCKINGSMSVLSNIYVYAEELGVFPNVEYIELYGQSLDSGLYTYEKIIIES